MSELKLISQCFLISIYGRTANPARVSVLCPCIFIVLERLGKWELGWQEKEIAK
jgi:hypothetical protein